MADDPWGRTDVKLAQHASRSYGASLMIVALFTVADQLVDELPRLDKRKRLVRLMAGDAVYEEILLVAERFEFDDVRAHVDHARTHRQAVLQRLA